MWRTNVKEKRPLHSDGQCRACERPQSHEWFNSAPIYTTWIVHCAHFRWRFLFVCLFSFFALHHQGMNAPPIFSVQLLCQVAKAIEMWTSFPTGYARMFSHLGREVSGSCSYFLHKFWGREVPTLPPGLLLPPPKLQKPRIVGSLCCLPAYFCWPGSSRESTKKNKTVRLRLTMSLSHCLHRGLPCKGLQNRSG